MKAAVYHEYGPPDVLELKEVPKPEPKDDQVLVRVKAVCINDWDWQLMLGTPFVNRMMNGIFRPKKMPVLGCDIAGIVEAAGEKVKQLKPGDAVYGDLSEAGFGGFAEYLCAPENALALKSPSMTFEQAAAIPQAGMLALQGLRDKWQLKDGQKILINGAGGGVGTFGIQIAKQYDVEVTGVDNAGKLDLMKERGFDHVIDYQKEDFTRSGKQYDLIIDNKTNRYVWNYLRVLNPGGLYAVLGGDTGKIMQIFALGSLVSKIAKKKVCVIMLKPNRDLAQINELFEAGKFNPVIDGSYTLDQVPEAMRYFGEGRHKGKVVITVEH
jgi:NADPH:quinone reductase-like Zn-dependent oxidoreductase